MVDSRRHTEQGEERKQQLLQAAEQLFTDRGYGATRISDICAAAGVAKGLFYWYFPTKESLFAELVRTMRHQLRRAQAAAMEPSADPVTRLRQGAEASVRFMAAHQTYFALLDVERLDAALAPVMREGSDVYASDVRRLIMEAQREGLVPDGDPTFYVVGVLGAVSSFGHAYRAGRLQIPIDDLAASVGRWVTDAVARPRDAARALTPTTGDDAP
ncbi:MAG: TetR/AcrR family transcriptional regulator [Actinomycetota bacterium]